MNSCEEQTDPKQCDALPECMFFSYNNKCMANCKYINNTLGVVNMCNINKSDCTYDLDKEKCEYKTITPFKTIYFYIVIVFLILVLYKGGDIWTELKGDYSLTKLKDNYSWTELKLKIKELKLKIKEKKLKYLFILILLILLILFIIFLISYYKKNSDDNCFIREGDIVCRSLEEIKNNINNSKANLFFKKGFDTCTYAPDLSDSTNPNKYPCKSAEWYMKNKNRLYRPTKQDTFHYIIKLILISILLVIVSIIILRHKSNNISNILLILLICGIFFVIIDRFNDNSENTKKGNMPCSYYDKKDECIMLGIGKTGECNFNDKTNTCYDNINDKNDDSSSGGVTQLNYTGWFIGIGVYYFLLLMAAILTKNYSKINNTLIVFIILASLISPLTYSIFTKILILSIISFISLILTIIYIFNNFGGFNVYKINYIMFILLLINIVILLSQVISLYFSENEDEQNKNKNANYIKWYGLIYAGVYTFIYICLFFYDIIVKIIGDWLF